MRAASLLLILGALAVGTGTRAQAPAAPATQVATAPATRTTPPDGPLLPYGVPASGGTKSTLFGIDGRGFRIAYVLDYSGSSPTSLKLLQQEVKQSINALSPVQMFGVIVFAGKRDGVEILDARDGPDTCHPRNEA